MEPCSTAVGTADLFGVVPPSSSLAVYKQVSDGTPLVCRCRKPDCLHVHEMNEDGTAGPWEIPVPTAVETWFRHWDWSVDREKVIAALVRASVPAKRVERFKACGASAYIEATRDGGEWRVRGFYCGDRFCRPCSRSRAARGRRAILALAGGRELRFITFARRSVHESLIDAIDELFRCFRKMRASETWKSHVDGGAGVLEIKRGAMSGHWHVHFHCLITGRRFDQAEFSDLWLWATGNSRVVDIRYVYDEEKGAGYVCKYLGKGFHPSVLDHPDDLAECVSALCGRRLLVTFGDWYGRLGDLEPESRREWKLVGGVHATVLAAQRGEPWAVGAMEALRAGKKSRDELNG